MNQEKKYKFPGFKCPNPKCGAKNIVFAASKKIYNRSQVILFEEAPENISADYIVLCPKCKSHIIICDKSMMNIPMIEMN